MCDPVYQIFGFVQTGFPDFWYVQTGFLAIAAKGVPQRPGKMRILEKCVCRCECG
jgi:hypothetical protein